MPTLDFPNQVNVQPAIGVAGDFASTNPRFSVPVGAGGLVAGTAGLTIGLAAWITNPDDANGAPAVANNFGVGPIAGICHREQQALITTYLSAAGMTIPSGFGVTLFSGGDIFVKNNGTTQALPGQTAYANQANGQFVFAAAGQTPVTATVTASIAAQTVLFTGSITDDVLTVSSVQSGSLVIGTTLGTTGPLTGNPQIVALGSGTGGTGTYILSIPEYTFASGSLSGSYGILSVGTVTSGVLGVGSVLTGSGVTGTLQINSVAAGTTNGIGSYYVTPSTGIGSGTFNASNAVSTKWQARSSGLVGELVKISDHLLG